MRETNIRCALTFEPGGGEALTERGKTRDDDGKTNMGKELDGGEGSGK